MLAKQRYIKVQREVSSVHQRDIEEERMLYLYEDKIITRHREFPIETVAEISYRSFGKETGLLYIHTSSGLYTYTVKTSTEIFRKAFNKIKRNP